MADTSLAVSIAANIVLAIANGVQGIFASRNTALKEENESLRRQLADYREGHAKLEAQEAERALQLEKKLKAGHDAWQQEQTMHRQILENGQDNYSSIVRSALAAAEIAQGKYLSMVDHVIDTAKALAAHELGMAREQIDELLDSNDVNRIQRAMMDHGRTINVLVMMKAIRKIASEGMEFCGRMTLLEASILDTGVSDPDKPIQIAIRDFLDSHPIYLVKDELGRQMEVRITMAEIERHWAFWRERAKERQAKGAS